MAKPDDDVRIDEAWIRGLPDAVKALLRIIAGTMGLNGLDDVCPQTRGQVRSLMAGFNREFPDF